MKFKKAVSAVLCGCVLAFSTGGCSIIDFSVDNLLHPPKAMGDEAEIEKLIADTAKGGYTLKYPKSGNYRSAIVMTDLNGDDTDEAVAFFRNSDDTAQIHMLVMYSDDDVWKLSSDFTVEATDIDSVDFADVNGDSALEIFAGYTTYAQNINHLYGYSYSKGKTVEIQSGHSYSAFYCGDFDSDGNSEIMSLLLYTTENEALASMLDYSAENNSLYAKAMASMDPNVIKFKNVSVSSYDNGKTGLFVDGSYANEEINTQIIYYSKELSLLRNPLYKEKTRNVTQRTNQVNSRDIDDDGKTEIPIVSKPFHSKEQTGESVADKITWCSFNEKGEALAPKLNVVSDFSNDYCFKIPEKWTDNSFTAVVDTISGTLSFYEWLSDKQGAELFEIKKISLESWNSGKDIDDYTLISKNDRYAFAFKNINAESPVSLTDEEIKTGFMILTDVAV